MSSIRTIPSPAVQAMHHVPSPPQKDPEEESPKHDPLNEPPEDVPPELDPNMPPADPARQVEGFGVPRAVVGNARRNSSRSPFHRGEQTLPGQRPVQPDYRGPVDVSWGL